MGPWATGLPSWVSVCSVTAARLSGSGPDNGSISSPWEFAASWVPSQIF